MEPLTLVLINPTLTYFRWGFGNGVFLVFFKDSWFFLPTTSGSRILDLEGLVLELIPLCVQF
jgi:hypothetical protein